MDEQRKFTKRDMRAVLKEAVSSGAPAGEEDYSLEELEEAAEEAGINRRRVQEAIRLVEQRKGFRSGLVFIALGGAVISAALILLPGRALWGWRDGSVLLHNSHRTAAYTFEVMVPTLARRHADCGAGAEPRLAPAEYCLARRVRLEPRHRTRIEIPRRPESCPHIWIRAASGSQPERSALFTLPSSIEIDRKGRLDQKGLGSPHMHPAPEDHTRSLAPCAPLARGTQDDS